MKTKTITEVASQGGKARWKGKTKKEISKHMSSIAKLPRKKPWDIGGSDKSKQTR